MERCVKSVLHQGLPDDAYEVLLVDDGSTDGSSMICDELSSCYPQIRTMHQESKGVAAARNNGIEAASGTWVAFLDADDYLLDDGYKIAFLPYANRSDVDIIHYFSDYDFWPIRKLEEGVRYEGHAYELMLEEKELLPSFCWLFFYKREFIERNKLRFKSYRVGEDQLFATSAYLANPYMLTVRANIYRYVVHAGSATTRRSVEYVRRCVQDYIASYSDILSFAYGRGIENTDDGGKNAGKPLSGTHEYDGDGMHLLWEKCMNTLNSKKIFAVSRMLSARYKHSEWNEVTKRCRQTGFFPVRVYFHGVKNRLLVIVMNQIMSSWKAYVIYSRVFNGFIAPYILPRLVYKAGKR